MNENFFDKNFESLRQYFPDIAARLHLPSPFELRVRPAPSGPLNLFASDATAENRPLYPTDDPVKDLPDILTQLSGTRGRIICLMGFGLGYHAVEIVTALGGRNTIAIFEASPTILKTAMMHSDLSPVFAHPNVRLTVGDLPDTEKLFCREQDALFAANRHLYVELGRVMALFPDWYSYVKTRVNRFVQGKIISAADVEKYGKTLYRNRFNNLSALSDSTPLSDLSNRFKDMPAIIVASGPSLSGNIHQLKSAVGKAIIIAADSAVAPLLEHDIIPDIVVSVDINDFTFEKLSPFVDKMRETGLLYLPEVTPTIPNYIKFAFKIFTLLSPHSAELLNRILGTDEKPFLYAQSVVHLAMHAAQVMGCNPIIFIGLDLAYEKNRDHALGTLLHWGNRQPGNRQSDMMVVGNSGELVATNLGLLNILETCQMIIRKVPARTYINATEGGARINGTLCLALSDVISRYCLRRISENGFPTAPRKMPAAFHLLDRLVDIRDKVGEHKRNMEIFEGWAGEIRLFLGTNKPTGRNADVFPEAIRRLIQNAQQMVEDSNRDPILMSLTDMVVAASDAYLAYYVGTMEARLSSDAAAVLNAEFDQRCFIHTQQAEALNLLSKHIEDQIRVFRNLKSAGETTQDDAGDPEKMYRMGAFLVERGYLVQAESVLSTTPETSPKKQFWEGCIRTKRGQITAGMALVAKAIQQHPALKKTGDDFVHALERQWLSQSGPMVFMKIVRKRVHLLNPSATALMQHWKLDAEKLEGTLSQDFLNEDAVDSLEEKLSGWDDFRQYLPEMEAFNNQCAAHRLAYSACQLRDGGDLTQAIQNMERAVQLIPEKQCWRRTLGALLAQYAEALIEGGSFKEGAEWLVTAVKLKPEVAYLCLNLGDILRKKHGYQEAITAYELYLTALPSKIDIFLKIGECYQSDGKMQAAMLAYQTVLKISPGHPAAKEAVLSLNKTLRC